MRLDISGQSQVEGYIKTDGNFDVELAKSSLFWGKVSASKSTWKLTHESRVEVDVDVKSAVLDASGASHVQLSGQSPHLSFVLSGVSQAQYMKIKSDVIDAKLSGSSQASIQHDGKLSAQIEGLSRLIFSGNPQITSLNLSGGGKLTPRRK